MNITKDKSEQFVTGPFYAGLKLFDTDDNARKLEKWKLLDDTINYQLTR